MLHECEGVDQYDRFCAVLTAYAESDFHDDAIQHGITVGVFQQDPRYWPSATLGTVAQCRAFLSDFALNSPLHTGDPVHDCWLTQRWEVPGSDWPRVGNEFDHARETVNYTNRLSQILGIIANRSL